MRQICVVRQRRPKQSTISPLKAGRPVCPIYQSSRPTSTLTCLRLFPDLFASAHCLEGTVPEGTVLPLAVAGLDHGAV